MHETQNPTKKTKKRKKTLLLKPLCFSFFIEEKERELRKQKTDILREQGFKVQARKQKMNGLG